MATLQRGFWLAVIFVILLWFVLYRKPIVIISIITLFFCCVFLSKYTLKSDLLISKLTQTSSSARYGNGTQGAAWDLIKMNPIKGYGYGGKIYDEIYNKESIYHPEWIFKKSIGPHNVLLSIWFSSGIFGLISFLYFIFEIVKTIITNLKKESDNYIFKVSLAIFIGNILIMGLFEDINIMNIAIILGFSFSLINKNS
ncbi:O-antigen ligase family protein [Arsenophonus sp.]|uniref:O-antigen ligase family protein n=1 Tax=Arsenophonus sp. TaxID=1872640 RepID=UPI0028631491|nr:O-antigen ligase family protein [Arsenophonus sp.]MDR5611261.1 O-antigen ligase family protein [Arsenophonus sp.]MDR5615268.1 O-antigen ligase family protein [Arsenophonus sp.]